MNGTNINTYFGAKWNVEICKSGISGIESRYPLGKDLKDNMILDNWIQSLIYLFSPSGGAIHPYCKGFSFAAITNGEVHIGSGTGAPLFSQTGLQRPIKVTSFIRPFFNECTGIYYPESGMAVFSRKYDFSLETSMVTYTEAGFRSSMANALPLSKRNQLWSRFVFTNETGVSGFFGGILSGNNIIPTNESGFYINNSSSYTLPISNIKEKENIIGFLSGRINSDGNFYPYINEPSINASGYIVDGKIYNFQPVSTGRHSNITGYISGYMDEFGNFSGFSPFRISGISGYINSNFSLVEFKPRKYLSTEIITGFISGTQDMFGNQLLLPGSGYFLNNTKNYFNSNFSGFSGEAGFDDEYGYIYSGYSSTGFLPESSGNIRILAITGYISGYRDQFGNFSGFDNRSVTGGSGYFTLDGRQNRFDPFRYFNTERITGFISGCISGGRIVPFTRSPGLTSGRASGYYINNSGVLFSDTVGLFSGFSGQAGFFNDWGFLYTGYRSWQGSGYSGVLVIENRPVVGFFSGTYTYNPNTFQIEKSGLMIRSIDNLITANYYTTINSINYDLLRICNTGSACNLNLSNISFDTSLGSIYSGLCNNFNTSSAYKKDLGIIELFRNPDCIFAQNIGAEIPTSQAHYHQREDYNFYSKGLIVGYAGHINVFQQSNLSGIITGLVGSRNLLETSGTFSGFDNQNYFKYSSFDYQGFFNGPSGFSGIEYANSGTGIITGKIGDIIICDKTGIITGTIGNRKRLTTDGIFSGFSGVLDIIPSNQNIYSGFFTSSSGFSGINFNNSGIGIMTGLIGSALLYYKSGQFTEFSGLPDFNNSYGYQYSGFFNLGSGISGAYSNDSDAQMTGIIGYRNIFYKNPSFNGFNGYPTFEYGWRYVWPKQTSKPILESGGYKSGFLSGSLPVKEPIVGFISGILNPDNSFYSFQNISPSSGSSGFSGVYIPEHSTYILNQESSIYPSGLKNVFYFVTGASSFSGFYNLPNFNFEMQSYFNNASGFLNYGFDYGYRTYGSGFVVRPVPLYQDIIGFLSGFKNEIGIFLPSKIYTSSGYFLNENKYVFNHGSLFSGFSGLSGFSSGFNYYGFSFPFGSSFSGVSDPNIGFGMMTGILGARITGFAYPNTGIGAMTGIIGWRNASKITNSGYITGLIGFKNILAPITLTTGEFLKLRYDAYMQVPAIVNPIPVTGLDVVHGEFNGSGEIKLIGQMQEIFGSVNGDGKITDGNGMWWPIHTTLHKNLTAQASSDSPYPNSHLSALMVKSGFTTGILNWEFNKTFPPINSGIPIQTLVLDDEMPICFDIPLGQCTGFTLYSLLNGNLNQNRDHREKLYYSYLGLGTRPSWPYYAHNTLRVNGYNIETNNPTGQWPSGLNIHMIFPGPYPNRDTGIGGFIICKATEGSAGCGRTITDLAGNVWGPNVYVKPSIYENLDAYLDCGIQRRYSAWYYKFNNPQIKYEDQMINLFLTFSLGRIEK